MPEEEVSFTREDKVLIKLWTSSYVHAARHGPQYAARFADSGVQQFLARLKPTTETNPHA